MSLIPRVLGKRGMATAASMPGVLVAPAARMLLANNPGKLTVEALAKTSLGRMPNGFTVITKVSPRTCRSSCVGRAMFEPIGIMGPSPLRAGERRCECVWPCGLTRTVDSRKTPSGFMQAPAAPQAHANRGTRIPANIPAAPMSPKSSPGCSRFFPPRCRLLPTEPGCSSSPWLVSCAIEVSPQIIV